MWKRKRRSSITATDRSGAALDLPTLKLGMGSVVQVLLTPGIYSAPLTDNGMAKLSLKLQGLRIIKLEQYGSGGPAIGEISEEDMALIGSDVEADDLSAYTKRAKEEHIVESAKAALRSPEGTEYAADDLDDEIPF